MKCDLYENLNFVECVYDTNIQTVSFPYDFWVKPTRVIHVPCVNRSGPYNMS